MISKNYTYIFLAGAVTGTVVAALYAPQSGDDTRARLRQGLDEAGDSLTKAGEYLRSQADRFNAEAQATIAHTQAQVQEVLDQAATALNTTLKQAGDAFAANSSLASAAVHSAIQSATGQSLP